MKYLLFINLLVANFIFAEYYDHPESQKIIKELVEVHNFDPNYVERVLMMQENNKKLLTLFQNQRSLLGLGIDTKSYLLKIKE